MPKKKPSTLDEFRAAANEVGRRGDVPADVMKLMNRMLVELGSQTKMAALNGELSATHSRRAEQFRKEARSDILTGMPNRRGFMEDFMRRVADSSRHPNRSHVLIITDVDGFKKVNDTYGHEVGDKLIKHIGDILRPPAPNEPPGKHHLLRPTDTAGRLGGDEFIMMLPEVRRDDAGKVIKLLQDRIKHEKPFTFTDPKSGQTVTMPVEMSMGFATFSTPATDKVFQRFAKNAEKQAGGATAESYFSFLYARADARLYKDKAMRKGTAAARNPARVAQTAQRRQAKSLDKVAKKLPGGGAPT